MNTELRIVKIQSHPFVFLLKGIYGTEVSNYISGNLIDRTVNQIIRWLIIVYQYGLQVAKYFEYQSEL